MRSIRKILVRLCVVLAFVIALESIVRFCYEDWKTVEMVTLSKQERGELRGTIDTIYCGTSVTYYAMNPRYLDKQFGTSSFNLGTGSQPLIGSYFLVRDAVAENPVKNVYLVLTLASLKSERNGLQHTSAYSNMRTWRWKLRYLLAMQDQDTALSLLFYSTNVDSWMQPELIRENIEYKLNPNLGTKCYVGRGFRNDGANKVFNGVPKRDTARQKDYWDGTKGAEQIDEQALEYMYKLGDFCEKKGIHLTVVIPPWTQVFIDMAGDLDGMDRCLRGLTQEMGADYYNFLLYKERTTVFTNEKFKDWMHFNKEGTKAFNRLFAQVLKSDRPEEYFYDSMEQFAEG